MERIPLIEDQGTTRVEIPRWVNPNADPIPVHVPLLTTSEGRAVVVQVERSELEGVVPTDPDSSFLAQLHLPEGDVSRASLSDFATEHFKVESQPKEEI